MDAKDVYQIYLGMKLHFTNKSYDYTKYGPKKISEEKIGKFYTISSYLSGKFKTRSDLETRLIAIFRNKVVWINEIDSPESRKIEKEYIANLRALRYNFEQEVEVISRQHPGIVSALKAPNAFSLPDINRMLLNKEVSIETYCILDKIFNFVETSNDLTWGDEKLRVRKYQKFFFIDDIQPFLAIVKNAIYNP